MFNRTTAAAFLIIATLSGCASLNPSCPPETLTTLLQADIPPPESAIPPLSSDELTLSVHRLVNEVRADHGLRPLTWEPRLAAVALSHSEDMASRAFFSHVNPDGEDPTDRARRLGIVVSRVENDGVRFGVGENLFLGHRFSEYRIYRTADDRVHCEFDWLTADELARRVVDDWTRSRTHRANMLSAEYRAHAIGVAAGSNGTVFLTQNLSPSVSGSRPIGARE